MEGKSVAGGVGATPVPMTVAVLVPAAVGILMVPVSVPAAVGEKLMARLQEAPGARGTLPTIDRQVEAGATGNSKPGTEARPVLK